MSTCLNNLYIASFDGLGSTDASHQGIQLLVNNAGVARDDNTKFSSAGQPDMKSAQAISDHFWKSPAESWDETFRINVTGHFFTSLAFLPLLEKGHSKIQGYTSSIVNVASISGKIGRAHV